VPSRVAVIKDYILDRGELQGTKITAPKAEHGIISMLVWYDTNQTMFSNHQAEVFNTPEWPFCPVSILLAMEALHTSYGESFISFLFP